MNTLINVQQKPIFDETITKKEYHNYSSYLQIYRNNDEIRIPIQNQDLLLLSCDSYIYIEGLVRATTKTDTKTHINPPNTAVLKNNCMAHLFDEIRYEINGMEIDRTRNLGVRTTLKNAVSLNQSESQMLENSGWSPNEELKIEKGQFNFMIPLKVLLGFAEDYNKVILNSKHELILIRSKSDENAVKSMDGTEIISLHITNILWKVPHIQLCDSSKLALFKTIKSSTPLQIAFRSWDSHINPMLSKGTNHLWNVKLSLQNEKPRFILIGFQNDTSKLENKFIHANLANIKVYLNSECYPYEDLGLNFDQTKYAVVYEMYSKFQQS